MINVESPLNLETTLGSLQFSHGSVQNIGMSISMIIGCELGDKSFIVTALLAYQYGRAAVFFGSYLALFFMTSFAVLVGRAAPFLFPKSITHILGGTLFLIFGVKMLKESKEVRESQQSLENEFDKVEKIIVNEEDMKKTLELGLPASNRSSSTLKDKFFKVFSMSCFKNLFSKKFSRAFIKAFALIFVSELGDRSQIATIVMSAKEKVLDVFIGANIGHMLCTMVAVIVGRYISNKIEMYKVLFFGGIVFMIFGILYIFQGF